MSRVRSSLSRAVRSSIPRDWRVPLLVGGASIPFSIASYLQDGSMMSLWTVVFAGVVVGFWTGGADRVGGRTGFVGGLAVFWIVAELLTLLPSLSGPWWFPAAAFVMVLVFAGLGVAFSTLLGKLGAWVGGWMAGHWGRERSASLDG